MIWIGRAYEATLDWALRHRAFMNLLTLVTVGVNGLALCGCAQGFSPRSGHRPAQRGSRGSAGCFLRRDGTVATGGIGRDPRAMPMVMGVVAVAGVGPLNPTTNVAHLAVTLRTRDERPERASAIGERLRRAITATVAGATVYVAPVQDVQIATRQSRSQYQYTLSSTDAAEVSTWSKALLERLRSDAALRNVALETQDGGLRTFVQIDREQAGRLGVSTQAVDDTLNDAFGQRQISTIYAQANQYRVILEAAPQYQVDPSALSKLYVGASGGAQVPIASFARVEQTTAPLAIAHQDQFPATTLSFDLAHGGSLGAALRAISRAEDDVGLPSSLIGRFTGEAAEFNQSLAGEPWLVLAAVVTIYIVLGLLYESFIHPLTILSTLPSAGVGPSSPS